MARGRVLITGGAGFIGAHTASKLLDRGYAVRVLDWLQPPIHEPGIRPPWLSPDVELVLGDVRDKDSVSRALEGIDIVVHLAAYQDYLPDFSTFFHTNTVGTAILYEVVVNRQLPVRKIVVASSQAIYGEGRYHCANHGIFHPTIRDDAQLRSGRWEIDCPNCGHAADWQPTDESEANAQNQYALSKYTQELVSLSLGRRYGIPTTCLRYSITQGRWQSPRNAYSGICRIFTLRALAGKPLLVFEDGLQYRDYVHVEDVANANMLAIEDARTDYEVYNVGGDVAITAMDYARLVVRVLGGDHQIQVPGYYRFGDTRHIVSDTRKLKALGWAPVHDAEHAIRDFADWVQTTGHRDESTDASLATMLRLGSLRRVVA